MFEKVKEFTKAVKEPKGECMKEALTEDIFVDMDTCREILLTQNSIKIDDALDIATEHVVMMDAMNEKLDKVLAKLDKGSK